MNKYNDTFTTTTWQVWVDDADDVAAARRLLIDSNQATQVVVQQEVIYVTFDEPQHAQAVADLVKVNLHGQPMPQGMDDLTWFTNRGWDTWVR